MQATTSRIDRRRLLELFLRSAVVVALPVHTGCERAQVGPATPSAGDDRFLSTPETRFLEAAVSRIIPADDLGPGALEAGVVVFLDRELGGKYGAGARTYTVGPYGPSTPFQGYQLPLTVADIYRISIAAIDRYCMEKWGKVFAGLPGHEQDDILRGVQELDEFADEENVPAKTFFALLLRDTKDGFFCDPAYGGNRDRIGWRLVDYPGGFGDYSDAIFARHPRSPADTRDTGAHGHNFVEAAE